MPVAAALAGHPRERWSERPPFVHVLTHKDLHLHPVSVQVRRSDMRGRTGQWVAPAQVKQFGLPAPIQRLLASESRERLSS